MTLAVAGGKAVRTQEFTPWPQYDHQEESALLEVLRSRAWGGYHDSVKKLEKDFAQFHDVPYSVSCANGTVALVAALRALGVGAGDEVIVPPYTFIASASAILLCDASPVFADIDPLSFNLSPAAVEAAITPRTRAIVAVHFGGRPAEMDELQKIASGHGLGLLEDAAHAHGARFRGVPVGGWGDVATFSFQSFKLITAGEGGMILSKSSEIAEKCWSYCNQGRKRDGGWFDHFTLGTNYRLTAFQSAILGVQLRRMQEQTNRRAANVTYFRKRLKEVQGLFLPEDDVRVENNPYYLLTFRYESKAFSGLSRDRAIEALQAEGIPFKQTYPHPLYRNPLFTDNIAALSKCSNWKAGQDYKTLSLPEAERVCKDGVWLSHNVFLGGAEDVDDVIDALRKLQQLSSTIL